MKSKRPRVPAKIMVGQVVASTNPVQYSCCRVLVICEMYDALSYKRICRFVKQEKL
tara:strand:+ start:80 stop:247 length:168 start_codon:yes stop_codon:yes gene_type:complete